MHPEKLDETLATVQKGNHLKSWDPGNLDVSCIMNHMNHMNHESSYKKYMRGDGKYYVNMISNSDQLVTFSEIVHSNLL